MGKQTKTPYALLGLLSLYPMTGYELKSFYDQSLRFFWSESFGQIYPSLKQLETEGLVSGKDEEADRGKGRRRYTITDEGREFLKDWLELPVENGTVRIELLLKMFFSHVGDGGIMQRHLRTALAEAEERLGVYKAIEARISQNPNIQMRTLHLMTLDYGQRQNQMIVDWSRDCLKTLEELETQPKKKSEKK